MNPIKSFFFKSDRFESRQSVRRDLWKSYASAHGMTHFHIDIGCHVNPIGATTPFDTQNKSRHFEWCDSSMSSSTPLHVTHFG
jgi:hypothetical protein